MGFGFDYILYINKKCLNNMQYNYNSDKQVCNVDIIYMYVYILHYA